MAALESLIKTALAAESTLTAIISSRYYSNEAPQNPTYPCIVYTVFIEEVWTFDQTTERALVQFDVLGNTYDETISIRGPLKTAMLNSSGFRALFSGQQTQAPDDQINAKREIIDFDVWYEP